MKKKFEGKEFSYDILKIFIFTSKKGSKAMNILRWSEGLRKWNEKKRKFIYVNSRIHPEKKNKGEHKNFLLPFHKIDHKT